MALFEEITTFTVDAVAKGKKLSRQASKIAALKYSNSVARSDVNKLYAQIGELYYKKHGLAPESGFQSLCDKVTDLQTQIRANESAITELKIDGVIDEVVVDPEDVP